MNKLEKLVSTGKSVAKLKGFVECEAGVNSNKVFIPIIVVGLEPRSDGLQIRALAGGSCIGSFILRPKDFIDSEDEVRRLIQRKETEAKAAQDRKKILGNTNSRGYRPLTRIGFVKQRLVDYVRQMSPKLRVEFVEVSVADELLKLKDDKPLGDNWNKQVNSGNAQSLVDLAVAIKHGIAPEGSGDWEDNLD